MGYIEFSESKDKVTFIFSNNSSLTPGSIGVSVTVSAEAIENLLGGLDHIALAEGHLPHDAKIHDVGKVLIVLNNLSLRLRDMFPDDWNNVDITGVWFDSDKGLAYFSLDRFKSIVRTDGHLFIFGD